LFKLVFAYTAGHFFAVKSRVASKIVGEQEEKG